MQELWKVCNDKKRYKRPLFLGNSNCSPGVQAVVTQLELFHGSFSPLLFAGKAGLQTVCFMALQFLTSGGFTVTCGHITLNCSGFFTCKHPETPMHLAVKI